jgi:hypothetical protein
MHYLNKRADAEFLLAAICVLLVEIVLVLCLWWTHGGK